MKAKRYILGVAVMTLGIFSLTAQNEVNISNTPPGFEPMLSSDKQPSTDVYKAESIIPQKKPVPYSYIREADVMWAKNIWRTIDLRHRMNMPLRYPLEGSISGGARFSLFGLLMEGIQTKEITPYEYNPITSWKDPFIKTTTLEQIYAATDGDSIFDADNNFLKMGQSKQNVMQFQLQEQWYFDKQHSTMKVRIIALAPVYYQYFDEFGQPYPSPRPSIPFIVYFPECRRLFATNGVYNPKNDAQVVSFDDLFFQRRFSSTVIAESNVFGNRMLTDYKVGQDILLEAERIKDDLFIMEHDLWEY